MAAEYDRKGEYPMDIFKKAHALGLANTHIEPEFGGKLKSGDIMEAALASF